MPNPSHNSILGYEPAELSGVDIRDFVHPDDQPVVEQAASDLVGSRKSSVFVDRLRHKMAPGVILKNSGTLLCNSGGDVEGIVVIGRGRRPHCDCKQFVTRNEGIGRCGP